MDFTVYCFDTYGHRVTAYNSYTSQDDFFDERIKPGTTSSSEWYWSLYGFTGTSRIRMAVYKYHTADGETIYIPSDEQQWVEYPN